MGLRTPETHFTRWHKTQSTEVDNPTPWEFYDRPLDAQSDKALHPSREGGKEGEMISVILQP